MANNFGRISGQLLKENLTRNGNDLAVDNDLLFLNVNSRYIGVNSDTPFRPLLVDGTSTTTDLVATGLSNPNLTFTTDHITSNGNINLSAAIKVYVDSITTDDIEINNNTISTITPATNLELRPNGTGNVNINSNLNITGKLYTPYDITLDGSIIFGNDLANDTVSFAADINSDIIPNVNAPAIDYPPAVTATWHSVRFRYDPTGYTNLFLFWYIANTPWNLWVDANVQIGNHVYATRDGVRRYYGTVTAKPVIPGISAGDQITFTVSNPENHPAYFDYPDPIYPTTFEISAVPDGVRGFSLGANPLTGNRWKEIYPLLANVQSINTDFLNIGSIDPTLRPGKVWYVSVNGNDLSVGNHAQAPFLTIKHALLGAQPGDEIFIFPGTYTEIFPLTVPVGVAVKGTGIRAVNVVPTVGTNTNNAFLLNGESTVSDLTVKDFYAPGYAFSFAPGFTVSSRSPYVQNITVITKGSVVSLTDPRGFDQGDAGGGARVDGSLATSASKEASMLFHSVTFITPGADALVMTNGVRVEWLNSFTYFANRGLYATNGTLGLASLGIRFGAEIRSIGSANVYGNYGAEANGASTLMYLVNHNFAYIGAGKDVTNDSSLNIAANETVEIATGKIYYQSLDNRGNFKVGDAFGVSFETGLVNINGVSVSAGGVTSINFLNGTDETVIDATQIITGNVKFSDNLLTTLSGDINLDSGTDEIKLNANTSVSNNLDIIGNLITDGTLTIGNAYIDIVRFTAPVEYALRPKTDDDYTLGGPTNKRWDKVYLDTSYIGSYKLENSTISTLPTNVDVELKANGTGKIYVPANNVALTQNLTVGGITNLGDNALTAAATVNGIIDHLGLLDRTGDTGQTGTYNQTGYLDVSSDVQIANIAFIDNTISTLTLDTNLELGAASTGKVKIPSADVQIDNNLFVTDNIQAGSVGVSTDITTDSYSNGNIEISLDLITTTLTDSNLEFRAAGTGKVYANQDSVKFDQDLTVDGITALRTTNITGTLTQYGDYLQTGDTLQTGNRSISSTLDVDSSVYFDSMSFVNNTIATTDADTDLQLKAALTGIVDINDNVTIDQNLRVNSTTYTNGITNSGITSSDTFSDGDIEISTNNIKTTVGNNNLRLLAAGTGIISVPNDLVQFDYDLTVGLSTSLKNTVIGAIGLPKNILLTGDYLQTGDTLQTGNRGISLTLDVDSNAYFDSMSFVNNVITTTDVDTDLLLKAAGTGLVVFDENTTFSQGLSVATLVINGLTNSGITTAGTLFDNDIEITSNNIKTTVGNNNLRLLAAGTGIISVPNDAVEFDLNLTVNGTTNLKNTVIGSAALNTSLSFSGSNYLSLSAAQTIGTQAYTFECFFYTASNGLQTILGASATGGMSIWLFGDGINPVTTIQIDRSYVDAAQYTVSAITINTWHHIAVTRDSLNNTSVFLDGVKATGATTNTANYTGPSGLIGAVAGSAYFFTGYLTQIKLAVGSNYYDPTAASISVPTAVLTTSANTKLLLIVANSVAYLTDTSGTQTVSNIGGVTYYATGPSTLNITHVGNYLQTGDTLQTGNRSISSTLDVDSNAYFDSISFVNNVITTTDVDTDLSLKAAGTIVVFDENTTFSQGLIVDTLVVSGLTNSGTITAGTLFDNDIEITSNIITTTVGNNDLRLLAAGAGAISMPLDPVLIDNDLTVAEISILKNTTIAGNLLHTGNTNQIGNVDQTGNLDISNNLTVTGSNAFFTDIRIIDNSISTSIASNDLRLLAAGTGIININDNATFNQNLRVNGIVYTNGITNSGTITSDIFTNSDIEINDNYITTTVGNNNLILIGNGTGGPKLEKIKFNSNVISTESGNDNITLTIPSGSVTISSTTALKVPVGAGLDRPTLIQGDLRFNTTDVSFNGFSTAKVTLGRVSSEDLRTNVSVHPTNNILTFTTNNLTALTVSSSGFALNTLTVDNNLTFTTNTISTTNTNEDLYLTPDGTGQVQIDAIAVVADEILNLNSSGALILQNTGAGYVSFGGTGALGIPAGPTVVNTAGIERGDFRFNTDLSIVEIFNGTAYVGLSGETGELLNAEEIQEITNLWALVLG